MVYLSAWDNCMTFPLGQGSQPMKKGWNEDWEKRMVQSEEALPHWTGLILKLPECKITRTVWVGYF